MFSHIEILSIPSRNITWAKLFPPLAKSSIFDPFLPTCHMWSQTAFLPHPITPPTTLCSNALESQRCSSTDSSWWVSCVETQAIYWDQSWSARGAQRRHPFLSDLNVGSHPPVCPHAPLGSWRWSSDGLVILGMGLGEARTGGYLGSPNQHGLSVVLTGSFWHIT